MPDTLHKHTSITSLSVLNTYLSTLMGTLSRDTVLLSSLWAPTVSL